MPFDSDKLDAFPTDPGVYLMKSTTGEVLYVGKAKNLRQRIRQYFVPGGDGRFIIPYLVSKVDAIETIVVTSEKEALLLENNLIKKHQPHYNALLKDDKSYIALKINPKQKWPLLKLVRYKGKPEQDGLLFGPYTSALGARKTLDLLNRLFPLRECSDQELARRTRPCILYDMKRCIAPCVNKCSKEEYDQYVAKSIKFLRGQDKETLKDLYDEMSKASEELEFEKAAMLLRTIRQVEATIEQQKVDKPFGMDGDALAIYRQGDEVVVCQLLFREGKLTGSKNFSFSNIAEDDADLLSSFLIQEYQFESEMPREILLPLTLEAKDSLEEILSTNKKYKTSLLTPQRGEKRALVEMALKNAEAAFKKEKDEQSIREKTLLDMQQKFNLSKLPRRIECFDNSNISGTEPVSCLAAFTDGLKDTSRYRRYKIKTVEGINDYTTMLEVLTRRFKRGKEENDLPDLLIVDGGKGHLNIAIKVLQDLEIINLDVIGVAKEQGRHDKGMTSEQIFLPNVKDPILLRHTSPILFLLQKIRDEAHRFAITYHRKRYSKQSIKSALDEIPGIGPSKRKNLLKHFGSIKKIAEANPEELSQVKGISKANIFSIQEFFKEKPI